MRVKPGPVEITAYQERKKQQHTKGQTTKDILEDNNVNE